MGLTPSFPAGAAALRDPSLVSVSSLGRVTCRSSSCPLDYLLHEHADSRPSESWWTSSWSYRFAQSEPDLKLVITLSRPVLLSKVELLCGGGMSSCPSKILLEVSTESEGDMMIQPPLKPAPTLQSRQGQGSSLELSWITVKVQLEDPKSVKRILLYISKPEESDFVYISGIKLLEYVPVSQSASQGQGVQIKATVSQSQKSLDAYHHFRTKLPLYSQALRERFKERAQRFIKLACGDADKNEMQTFPYEVLNWLLETHPLSSEEGRNLRKSMVDYKAIDLVLKHLNSTAARSNPSTSTSSSSSSSLVSVIWESAYSEYSKERAKRTRNGTGSSSRLPSRTNNVQHADEMAICLLGVLNNFISTSPAPATDERIGEMNAFFLDVNELLKTSCLIPLMLSYLRNDSVLDIAGHFPLYRMIFKLLRSMASHVELAPLLVSSEGEPVISSSLIKMKDAVDSYAKLLQASSSQDVDLFQLMKDIETTASQVENAVKERRKVEKVEREEQVGTFKGVSTVAPKTSTLENHGLRVQEMELEEQSGAIEGQSTVTPKTLEHRYVEEMEKLRFDFQEMIADGPVFKVPYHYESTVRKNWSESGHRISKRAKRLAQEAVTLQKSLPVSWGSSIFVRCDNDRLDVMKVLITGPSGTPYANGCFEFDVHFPLDYPNSPPMVNFETTGGKKIRFNPNLYANGKVCLSLLNTWHGTPEEKWNPKTSSLLFVLVAIQSLILVEEPYWNEPGVPIISGTYFGKKWSNDYSAQIRHFTLYYAILNQIRQPSSCFKEVIHRHFWMKREEILTQCKKWTKQTMSSTRDAFKKTVTALKNELLKMTPPEGLEDLELDAAVLRDDDDFDDIYEEADEGMCVVQ